MFEVLLERVRPEIDEMTGADPEGLADAELADDTLALAGLVARLEGQLAVMAAARGSSTAPASRGSTSNSRHWNPHCSIWPGTGPCGISRPPAPTSATLRSPRAPNRGRRTV
jgi:hypothetical protein